MGFSRWLSVADDFFALIPSFKRNGGLGVSSLLLSLIEFHGGSAEKCCCLRNGQRFWSLKVGVLVVPGVSCDVSWSISCRESFFPQRILSQERVHFVGFVEFRIGSVSCNEPLSSRSSGPFLRLTLVKISHRHELCISSSEDRLKLSPQIVEPPSLSFSLHSLIRIPVLSSSSSEGAVRVVVIAWSKYLLQFLVTLLDPL